MFGKKKQVKNTSKPISSLSEVAQTANELRKAVLLSQRKCERIVERHTRELEGVKDKKKRIEIDNKYGAALLSAEHDADAIYANYYNHIHSNFTDDEISEAGARYGLFMDKKFINNLDKLQKNKKPVKPAAGTSASKSKAAQSTAGKTADKKKKK